MLRAVGGKKHKTSEMLSVPRPEDGCCIPVLGACDLRQPSLACLVLCVCVWPSLGPQLKIPHGICSLGDRGHKQGTYVAHNLNPFVR